MKENQVGWMAWQTTTWAVSVKNRWERRELLEIVKKRISQERVSLLMAVQDQTVATKAYRVTILNHKAAGSVGCVTRETRLLCISSVNVQSWPKPGIRTAMIRSPRWFNYGLLKTMQQVWFWTCQTLGWTQRIRKGRSCKISKSEPTVL